MSDVELTLYNTLTRSKERFEPIDPKNVRMYVCGPTVYDYAHIGNARPVIVFDVLFRLLRHVYGEGNVTYVRNITDVDDKIIDRARRDHPDMPLNEAIRAVTEKTANQFQADMRALGCLDPTHEPRATEFVLPRADGKTDMVSMIQILIDKDHAYVAKGEKGREVLFRVASMSDYGALSNRRLDEQQAGARVAVEDHKENPADFVLWKESSDDEPGWDATFSGETIHGRPGWHIECSAMAEACLGETFDIHGGGLDLIFPHHENEIAQSRCCRGTEKMANIWMHNGFLQVEGQKMSKSLGNFHTVHDVLHTDKVGGREWPGKVVRLAMLMTHYREPIDFSVRRLEEAEEILWRWFNVSSFTTKQYSIPPDEQVIKAFSDDLGLAGAMPRLHYLSQDLDAIGEMRHRKLEATLRWLGLEPTREIFSRYRIEHDPIRQAQIKDQVEFRSRLIAQKKWPEADRIRDELLDQGIQLKDSKDPETGERITTWEVKR